MQLESETRNSEMVQLAEWDGRTILYTERDVQLNTGSWSSFASTQTVM